MLRKFGIIAVLSLIVVALAAVPALGAKSTSSGIHFVEDPDCTFDATTNTISCVGGKVAGVGSEPVSVFYNVEGGCFTPSNSPNGPQQPPGHLQSPAQELTPKGGSIRLTNETLTVDCGGQGLDEFIDPSTLTLVIFSAEDENVILARLDVPGI